MPLKHCTSNGESGYKWGDEGHCYTGPGAREKALKQGRAIQVSQSKAALEALEKYEKEQENDNTV